MVRAGGQGTGVRDRRARGGQQGQDRVKTLDGVPETEQGVPAGQVLSRHNYGVVRGRRGRGGQGDGESLRECSIRRASVDSPLGYPRWRREEASQGGKNHARLGSGVGSGVRLLLLLRWLLSRPWPLVGRRLGAIRGRGVEQIARRRRVKISILTPSLHMDLVNPVLKEAGGLATAEQGIPHRARDSSKGRAPLSVLGGQEDHRPQ